MSANDELMTKKLDKAEKYNNEKHMDRMNYFPFTHGDAIEEQRKNLAGTQKIELMEIFKNN